MCYFLLAEWNEISGKYFSHTAGGLEIAHVTYGGWCVLLHAPLPTCFPPFPPLDFKFSASWLSNSLYVCVQIFCWVWNKGMAVRVSHGYQWCVINKQWNDTLNIEVWCKRMFKVLLKKKEHVCGAWWNIFHVNNTTFIFYCKFLIRGWVPHTQHMRRSAKLTVTKRYPIW